jgi:PAS domain S-box-containing protein
MDPKRRPGASSGPREDAQGEAGPPTSRRWEELVLRSRLFDAAPVVLCIFDRDLRIMTVNEAATRAAGRSAQEMLGLHGSELVGGTTAAAMRASFDTVLATGEAIVDEEVTTTRPGDPPERRVWRVSRYPLRDTAGAVVAVGYAVEDVTEQRRAEAERDRVERRLRLLGRASALLDTSLDLSATIREIVTVVVPEFADVCELFLADEPYPAEADPDPLILRRVLWAYSPELPAPPGDLRPPHGEVIRVSKGYALQRVFATRKPVPVSPDDPRTVDLPAPYLSALVQHFQLRSGIIVPLLASGEFHGELTFAVTAARSYDAQDVQTAAEVGSRIASAIANARVFAYQRTAALTLQRALLPSDVPPIDALDLAWRYETGTVGTEAGGDWFDVIPLRCGRVALVIGDVMGRGLPAAALMGQLRGATRLLTRLGLSPADILTELDATTQDLDTESDGALASVIYALWEPATETVRLANAGHLPPALRHPDGSVALLDDTHSMILGVGSAEKATESRHRFPAGSTLALYTDGVVESPTVDIAEGCDRLLRALADPTDLTTTADRLLTLIDRGGGFDDDATLLLARRHP